jgi:hypothetical protein
MLGGWGTAARGEAEALTFEEHIRPIFRAYCYDCHGAADEVKGGLDLRLVRWMKEGGDGGPAIVPGQPAESFLLNRLLAGEMPPGEKKVPPRDIETIAKWIAAGAVTAGPEPDSMGPGLGITDQERSFWSFQPLAGVQIPDLSSYPVEARVRTPIDALLIEADPDGNEFSPDADRRTLIKRAYFDLIGLPPSPEEVQRWLSEPGDTWYDRLLSELFASPHYGERWARHWLDVAGYADSEGFTESDAVREWAWKFRDWVIRAINDDMPFDRFVTEQLAGDELAGPIVGDPSPSQIDLFTATGFLRMAADGTGSGADSAQAKNQVIADTLKIVGTGLLGLSMQCAQCHDHRYDPIPQTDYYALRAVFEPALDWQAWKPPQSRLISLYTAADREQAAAVEAEAQVIAAERAARQAEYMAQALEKTLEKFEEPLRSQLRQACQTPADQRPKEQQELIEQHPSVNITPGVLYQYLPQAAEDLKKFDERINQTRAKKPVEEFIRALVEPADHAPETRLFYRGDHEQPKQVIGPAAPTVLAPAGQRFQFAINDDAIPTTGRRLAFAKWLTSGAHPLPARVIVNRIWMHHFGRGLVATPGDFGKLGTAPSNPRLLDWLAGEFMREGWSLKKLHRLIMTSTAWRQSKRPLVRLEAEAIRDRMLAASGQLDRTLFGRPLAIGEDDAGQVIVEGDSPRRSLYIQVRRSRPVAMLAAFDAPVMETNCESRPTSTAATQSLMLINGQFVLAQAAKLAERAVAEAQVDSESVRDLLAEMAALEEHALAPDDVAAQIVRAWELALCRPPAPREFALATLFVSRQSTATDGLPEGQTAAQQALTNLCQALLTCNEFLYVD